MKTYRVKSKIYEPGGYWAHPGQTVQRPDDFKGDPNLEEVVETPKAESKPEKTG